MNLPSYFIADLPAEAELSAALITEACQTLKRNAAQFLENRSTESIIRTLDRLGREWLQDNYPLREAILDACPISTGFTAEVLAAGLDQFFQQLTIENLETLVRRELGHAHRLDEFHASEIEGNPHHLTMAVGPRLLAHFAPGNIPIPALMEMVLGLLARSAQFVKCASGHSFVPRMFAHSLYEADHKLGACLEVASWKGGSAHLEQALLAESDCVIATGSDETLAAIRHKTPISARFIGYGEKVSMAYITRDALERDLRGVAERAATDITAWNQRGCLSPHVIYVEEVYNGAGEEFANTLAQQLEARERTHPRGGLSVREAAAIASRRSFYEVRAAHSLTTKLWSSPESTAWTVVLETDARFQISCQNRFIYVKVVGELAQMFQGAATVSHQVSTVGLACAPAQAAVLAKRLAQWGAKRVCPLGQMQNPPLGWHHDGRPPLGDLVTWVDFERHGK